MDLFENIFPVVKENKISILKDFASPAIKELILEKKSERGKTIFCLMFHLFPLKKFGLKWQEIKFDAMHFYEDEEVFSCQS